MRLGGRLAAAIEVLEDIERRHRPAADALRDWGLSHRFAGAGDRGAIGNIVYDALRRRRSAGWLLGAETPRAAAFGATLLESDLSAEKLNAVLDGDRFAPSPLTPDEMAAAQRPLAEAPPAVRADIPDWCVPLFEAAYRDAWAEEGRALAARPPLDLRVNTLLASRAKVLAELAPSGASACAIAPDGLRIPPIAGAGRHPNVQAEPAFQKGWFEVQDEGSQVAALLAGAAPGMQVLDFCAGGGGKTLALAAAMENRGQIYAHDSEKVRLAPIFDRLKRAEARNVQAIARPADLAPLEGRMDLVLVDAPCTGSGTWRRKPDAKWRLSERQLGVRRAEQETILNAAARYVRPGGRLVYVTCSVFRDENHVQVAAFLSRHADFAVCDHAAAVAASFPALEDRFFAGVDGIAMSPLRSGTDGFFVALMERRG